MAHILLLHTLVIKKLTGGDMKNIALSIVFASMLALSACGTQMTVTQVDKSIDPPPSDVRSAGTLSGASYSTGGEHYETMHTLGSDLGSQIQNSENGRYEVQ